MNEQSHSTVFLPMKSNGGIWSIGFLIGSALIFGIPMIFLGFINDPWFFAFMGVLMALIIGLFGFTLHGYYSMKYMLSSDILILKWSVFSRRIPLDDIHSVSAVSNPNLEGIRSFGVGIPGYLVGKFRLKIEGEYLLTTLFATKIENLVLIKTTGDKIFGITPDKRDEFINTLTSVKPTVLQTELDTSKPIRLNESLAKTSRIWITIIFSFCLLFAIGVLTYTIIMYQLLPDVIPLHWGIGGLPDRLGDKSELLIIVSAFSGIEIIGSILVYIWMRKSDMGKVKLGILIMLFPLIITLVFSTLIVVIMQMTFEYVSVI